MTTETQATLPPPTALHGRLQIDWGSGGPKCCAWTRHQDTLLMGSSRARLLTYRDKGRRHSALNRMFQDLPSSLSEDAAQKGIDLNQAEASRILQCSLREIAFIYGDRLRTDLRQERIAEPELWQAVESSLNLDDRPLRFIRQPALARCNGEIIAQAYAALLHIAHHRAPYDAPGFAEQVWRYGLVIVHGGRNTQQLIYLSARDCQNPDELVEQMRADRFPVLDFQSTSRRIPAGQSAAIILPGDRPALASLLSAYTRKRRTEIVDLLTRQQQWTQQQLQGLGFIPDPNAARVYQGSFRYGLTVPCEPERLKRTIEGAIHSDIPLRELMKKHSAQVSYLTGGSAVQAGGPQLLVEHPDGWPTSIVPIID